MTGVIHNQGRQARQPIRFEKVDAAERYYELGAALLEHVIFLVPHALERFFGEMRHGIGAHIVGGEV